MSGPSIILDEQAMARLAEAAASAAVRAVSAGAPAPAASYAPAPGAWPANVATGPWTPPTPAMLPAGAHPGAAPSPSGIALKLTLQLPDGTEMPVDLQFGPEYANPQALQALAGHLLAAGWPLKTYQPRGNGFGNGFGRGRFGGGNGFGGGNNYGGGFRRGGRW